MENINKKRIQESNYPVAENIKRIIKENVLNQPEIARMAGMKPRSLSDIICGYRLIKANEIERIADALSVNVEELFVVEPDDSNYII